MQIKEVTIVMKVHIDNMPHLETKEEIADCINTLADEGHIFFNLDKDNILDVRNYNLSTNE